MLTSELIGSYGFMERLLTKGLSMQITLELSPDVEVRLRESVADGDAEAVRRLLEEALTPTVEALLRETPAELTDSEFEVVADQLAGRTHSESWIKCAFAVRLCGEPGRYL